MTGANIKELIRRNAIEKEIKDFADDAFDYVWQKQKFYNSTFEERLRNDYDLRFPQRCNRIINPFTKDIGKAIRVSQFLLREYFRTFLETIVSDENFYIDCRSLWLDWIKDRVNIFVIVIETVAIIAEIFLFCDYRCKRFLTDLNFAKTWFVEWFQDKLASDFFQCGGWPELDALSADLYCCNFVNLNVENNIDEYQAYSEFLYSPLLIWQLMHSPISYPIPFHKMRNTVLLKDHVKLLEVSYERVLTIDASESASKDDIEPQKKSPEDDDVSPGGAPKYIVEVENAPIGHIASNEDKLDVKFVQENYEPITLRRKAVHYGVWDYQDLPEVRQLDRPPKIDIVQSYDVKLFPDAVNRSFWSAHNDLMRLVQLCKTSFLPTSQTELVLFSDRYRCSMYELIKDCYFRIPGNTKPVIITEFKGTRPVATEVSESESGPVGSAYESVSTSMPSAAKFTESFEDPLKLMLFDVPFYFVGRRRIHQKRKMPDEQSENWEFRKRPKSRKYIPRPTPL